MANITFDAFSGDFDSANVSFENTLVSTGTLAAVEASDAFSASGAVTTPASPSTGASSAAGRSKRRRVIIGDEIYDVPERDVPALLEAKLLNRKAPSTVKVVKSKASKKVEPVSQPAVAVQTPSVDEAAERYTQIAMQLKAQDDVRRMLDKVAQRVIAELEDEEDAAALLLLL